MIYRVILHPGASEELDAAYQWIAERAPLNAAQWYNRMMARMRTLERFHNRCATAPETKSGTHFRHFIEGNYRIIFYVDGNAVHVLHIRHAARRPIGEEDDGE